MDFGIIGAGLYAKHRVLPSIASSTRANVVSIQRRDQQALGELAKQFGVKHLTSSIDELLAQKLDAVWICSPNKLHHTQALQAIASKRHVLVEKPAALNQSQVAQISAAAKKAGVYVGVGFCCRYSPSVVAAKQAIASLGEIVHVSGILSINRRDAVSGPRYLPWMLEAEGEGTGVLFDLGCHALDLLYHLTGDDWAVEAAVKTDFNSEVSAEDIRITDSASILMKGRKSERTAAIFVSHRSARSSEFALVGTKGTMLLGFPFGKDSLQSLTLISEAQVQETKFFADCDVQRDFLEAFVDACGGKAKGFPTIDDSIIVQQWMDQVRKLYNDERR